MRGYLRSLPKPRPSRRTLPKVISQICLDPNRRDRETGRPLGAVYACNCNACGAQAPKHADPGEAAEKARALGFDTISRKLDDMHGMAWLCQDCLTVLAADKTMGNMAPDTVMWNAQLAPVGVTHQMVNHPDGHTAVRLTAQGQAFNRINASGYEGPLEKLIAWMGGWLPTPVEIEYD